MGDACRCKPQDRTRWVVTARRCNYSAFSGYHYTPSNYSAVRCTACRAVWRTRAKYVDQLPDDTEGERDAVERAQGGEVHR